MAEVDIAAPVVAWLEAQHWDVFQEVERYTGGPRADLVAIRGKLVWVLEVKATLGLAVMQQARSWPVHFRSIVVPETKARPFRDRVTSERRFAEYLCSHVLHVGLLTVNTHPASPWEPPVRVVLEAPLQRHMHEAAAELAKRCLPGHKTHAVAGSTRGGHFTPYRATMESIEALLRRHPNGLTVREIFADIGRGHYHTDASAKSQIGHCLEAYEADWCDVDKTTKPWKFRVRPDGSNA